MSAERDPLDNDVVTYTGHVQPSREQGVPPFQVTIPADLMHSFNRWLDSVGMGVAYLGPDEAGVEVYVVVIARPVKGG